MLSGNLQLKALNVSYFVCHALTRAAAPHTNLKILSFSSFWKVWLLVIVCLLEVVHLIRLFLVLLFLPSLSVVIEILKDVSADLIVLLKDHRSQYSHVFNTPFDLFQVVACQCLAVNYLHVPYYVF